MVQWLYLENTSFFLMRTATCQIFGRCSIDSSSLLLNTHDNAVFIGDSLEKVETTETPTLTKNDSDLPNEHSESF